MVVSHPSNLSISGRKLLFVFVWQNCNYGSAARASHFLFLFEYYSVLELLSAACASGLFHFIGLCFVSQTEAGILSLLCFPRLYWCECCAFSDLLIRTSGRCLASLQFGNTRDGNIFVEHVMLHHKLFESEKRILCSAQILCSRTPYLEQHPQDPRVWGNF